MMAYCPSPLLLRSTVTPDILLITFATVMSGESSMAFALITLTTLTEFFSIFLAATSDRPRPVAVTTAASSITISGSMEIRSSSNGILNSTSWSL